MSESKKKRPPRSPKQFRWESPQEKNTAYYLADQVDEVFEDAVLRAKKQNYHLTDEDRLEMFSKSITAVLRGENYERTTSTAEYKRWRQAIRVAYKEKRAAELAEMREAYQQLKEEERRGHLLDVIRRDREFLDQIGHENEEVTYYDTMSAEQKKGFWKNGLR